MSIPDSFVATTRMRSWVWLASRLMILAAKAALTISWWNFFEFRLRLRNHDEPSLAQDQPMPALGRMLVIGMVGAVIAGAYGISHDQVTFTISPEDCTKFKIHQFHYLGRELGMRVLVLKIGFLATWWVGFFAGWFIGRVLVPKMGFHTVFSLSLK